MGMAFLIFFGDKSKEEIEKEIKRLDDKIVRTEADLTTYKASRNELIEILKTKNESYHKIKN